MRVNFSVTNQLASPSIHAAALANRPAAGQPGRVFIDTDNPSTGIYRDTGTAWVQIAQNGGGGGTLQTVTTAGNTTNLNLVLTYEDSTVSNALVFYNEDQAQEEYVVLKRQTGITTNDCLVIQSRGNISPSTNPAGIMIDGANDVIKTFYTTAFTEQGLKLDFANNTYIIGDENLNFVRIANATNTTEIQSAVVSIGDVFSFSNQITFTLDNVNNYIVSQVGGNDIGLKLDFANSNYWLGDYNNIQNGGVFVVNVGAPEMYSKFSTGNIGINISESNQFLGDFGGISNGTRLYVDSGIGSTDTIKTQYQGNDIGLKLDFANSIYFLGDPSAYMGFYQDINTQLTRMGDQLQNGQWIEIDSPNGITKTTFGTNDIGLKLDFSSNIYYFGDQNINEIYLQIDATGGDIYLKALTNGGHIINEFTSSFEINGQTNSTFLRVNDTNQRLEVSGNLLSGTAGGNSGQHLKIRIGGTDYKIALLNP